MATRRTGVQQGVVTALTFTVGAALGALAGMIFAPESGSKLRRRFILQTKTLQRSSQREIKKAQRLLRQQAGKLRTAAIHAYTQAKKQVTNGYKPLVRRAVRHAVRHA